MAGSFYPKEPSALATLVDRLLSAARLVTGSDAPKALIVPHAGYIYSGPIAASAYARLRNVAGRIRRVVLLGPSHFVPFDGLALPGTSTWATPLGEVPIETEAAARLPGVVTLPAAHAKEHSLEVQLPFLQRLLPRFSLVPLVVGRASAEEVAAVLEALWGGEETLVLLSSDLSHYLPYEAAQAVDLATAACIEGLSLAPLQGEDACGARGVNGLLVTARRRRLTVERLDLRSSGDTEGDRDRVVGYGAFAFFESEKNALVVGKTLLSLARGALVETFGGPELVVPREAWLQEHRSCFVTLTCEGQLRGCIGSIEAHRPLAEEVVHNARGAAFEDPRFSPLTAAELSSTRIELCVLTPLQRLEAQTEEEAIARLRPGQDGVVLEWGGRRGVFIPKMWERLPRPAQFLAMLRQKAGLPAHEWASGTRLFRFTAQEYEEERQNQ